MQWSCALAFQRIRWTWVNDTSNWKRVSQRRMMVEGSCMSHNYRQIPVYSVSLSTSAVTRPWSNIGVAAPGPALFFIVVDGIPSNASWVMIGDGIIGEQTLHEKSVLPRSQISAQIMAQYGFITYSTNTTSTATTTWGSWKLAGMSLMCLWGGIVLL